MVSFYQLVAVVFLGVFGGMELLLGSRVVLCYCGGVGDWQHVSLVWD